MGFKVSDVKVALEPSSETGGPLAFLLEPNGIWIELFQYSEET